MTVYDEKRKQLLMLMDEGNRISNLDLGMYDLTPYYSDNNLSDSLVEKILFVQNDLRQVQHIDDKKVCFSPPQNDALNFLMKNSRCILSAPTSFGKTLIVKEYIFINSPKTVVYIVPTNALAYELENSFKNNNYFNSYNIFDRRKTDVSFPIVEGQSFFIGTQEKYLEIKDTLPDKIDLFVIDEAYKLEESTKQQRGYRLSESFLDSISVNSEKIFLLSPTAKFVGFDKYGFKTYSSTYNAVDKVFRKVEKQSFFQLLYEKSKNEKTILYCDSPSMINDTIDKIDQFDNKKNLDFISFLEKEYHPDWSVVKLLKKGVLLHHGQMPKYVQNKMINLFVGNNDFKLLVGTNSISEGINTPTKNIFIHPDCKKILEKTFLLKNTIGRAGRLGEYPIGYIYSVNDISNMMMDNIEICLSICNEEELGKIENSKKDEYIEALCSDYEIDRNLYERIRKRTHFSISIISKLLQVLKEDLKYDDISNLPFMAQKVFSEYKMYNADIDKICIKGVLQYYYMENGKKVNLNSFGNKIAFYRKNKAEEISNSRIIDYYMRFEYSSLEHYIYPIAAVFKEIYDSYPHWKFGNNVIKMIANFLDKYNNKVLGLSNADKYSDEQKAILQTLKDYGIIINNKTINYEMIVEIENKLNTRYSTYDVINAIKYLALNSKKYRFKFVNLKNRYID